MSDDTLTVAAVTIGYGGWTAYPTRVPGATSHTTRISGYGDDWRRYLPQMPPDAPVVNLRAIPETDERLFVLAVAGPMIDTETPDGMVRGAALVPFDPRPQVGRPERCALLGNAHGLDYVSPATYAALAAAHGAAVTTAAHEVECLPYLDRIEAEEAHGSFMDELTYTEETIR